MNFTTSVHQKHIILLIGALFICGISLSQTFPGFDLIGKGYNVFDEFANNKSTERYPLFDFSSLKKKQDAYGHELPQLITLDNISDHIVKTIEGNSIAEYSKNLTDKVGLSGNAFYFKASVENQFSVQSDESHEFLYYTYMDINTKWRVNLDTRNLDTLRKHLDSQFKADLSSMNPDKLFDLYGTHFIAHAYLGGRIDYSTVSEINQWTSKSEIVDAVNGSYFAISGSYEQKQTNLSLLERSRTKTHLNVVGGNSEYARSINNHEQYLKWAEGIKTRPVLCGFDDNSLLPIWTLCSSSKRKSELENYFLNIIIPKHPLPKSFKRDEILDGTEIVKPMILNLDKFKIIKDCDGGTLLTGDEPGEFKYWIDFKVNGELVHEKNSPSGRYYSVWGGNSLSVNDVFEFSVSLHPESEISITVNLTEVDDISANETFQGRIRTHPFPFGERQLYNTEERGYKYSKIDLNYSSECKARFYYQIVPNPNQTAYDFGNKGWEEFEKGNYDKCLEYSKEALSVDNSLGYVHYNVALVYLIQKNPMTFEKYKNSTTYFPEKKSIKAALKNIKDYEQVHGVMTNSEPIKLLLNSFLK